MKKVFIILIMAPLFLKAQKVYNVEGMIAIGPQMQKLNPGLGVSKIKGITIKISDSLFIQTFEGRSDSFKITKKANENYFIMSDGLKDFTVKIDHQSPVYKKYSGSIVVEAPDHSKTIQYFK